MNYTIPHYKHTHNTIFFGDEVVNEVEKEQEIKKSFPQTSRKGNELDLLMMMRL